MTGNRPFRQKRLIPSYVDLKFLLERNYPKAGALRFVGDHYQLRQEERDALYRAAFPDDVCAERRRKRLTLSALRHKSLVMDGHNVLITLESALASKPLVLSDDGFVRDVSRVFRSFRPTARTRDAWMLVQKLLIDYPPGSVTVILDAPLSRSGELAGRIRRWMTDAPWPGEVRLEKMPEAAVLNTPGVKASADSMVLDRADEIIDLAGHIIRRRMGIRPFVFRRKRTDGPNTGFRC